MDKGGETESKPDADNSGHAKPNADDPDHTKSNADDPGYAKPNADNSGSAKPNADDPGHAKPNADNPGHAKPDTDNSGSAKPDTDNSDTECNACANTAADRTTDTETTEAPVEEGNEEGTFIKDSQGSTFKITNADSENPEVQYEAPAKNAKGKVKVPAFVKVNGVTYQVTSVSGKAFKGNSKVTKIIIGKNVTKIGKKAFSKCKKLKLLVIKSRKLKTKNVAKNAFKGITKKTTVKVPKSKIKAYRKLLRKKGLSSKVKAIKRVYSSQEV